MQLNAGVEFKPLLSAEPPPLGPFADLIGVWKGEGLNIIWRPCAPPPVDHFLEINLTEDFIKADEIPGTIPNRGLLQGDIAMRGVTYLQQITDANTGSALHIEPGIWAIVPPTTNPPLSQTVVRMASIPHGTAILAQGVAQTSDGPPTIPDIDIVPFFIGNPSNKQNFPEQVLSTPGGSRSPAEQLTGVTQQMLDNPNSILQSVIKGQEIASTTTIVVTTTSTPVPGGGIASTAFLQGIGQPNQPNANPSKVEATFWIQKVEGPEKFLQIQYSQLVLLDFNGLSWPHVSVGTLRKQLSS